uniref:Uncharacterized protein n=1 Tax=Rhizophora mucronata TaxID=61149 RepID=A0A2P2MJX6_RHIMU
MIRVQSWQLMLLSSCEEPMNCLTVITYVFLCPKCEAYL